MSAETPDVCGMDDHALAQLIVAVGEIDRLDDPRAPDPRTEACVAMSRLESIALAARQALDRTKVCQGQATGDERAHLARCRICGPRLRALRSYTETRMRAPYILTAVRVRRWTAALAGLAAAACLLLLLNAEPPTRRMSVRLAQPPSGVGSAIPVRIHHDAGAAYSDDRCIARFRNTADESGVVMALLRLWDHGCQCESWQLYEWTSGEAVARLVAGKPFLVAVDMTDSPPAEQLLVLAMSRNADDLPDDHAETAALLACLVSSPLETHAPDEIADFALAVRTCLPPGVTVVPHAFGAERVAR